MGEYSSVHLAQSVIVLFFARSCTYFIYFNNSIIIFVTRTTSSFLCALLSCAFTLTAAVFAVGKYKKERVIFLNYETFKESVRALIQIKMGEEVAVKIHNIPKNNGLTKAALVIVRKEAHITPTLYLERYFTMYKSGVPMEEIIDRIQADYQSGSIPDIKSGFFTDFERAKKHICYKIINQTKNEKLLKQIPHLNVLDLAVVFYYKVEAEVEGGATILIYESHRKSWGITLDELYHLAKENTEKKLPPLFQTIHQVINSIAKEEALDIHLKEKERGETEMYILTNSEKYLGAGCFLYPGMLDEIATKLKANFYILPSSIHECIIMPDSGEFSSTQLNVIVQEMNAQFLGAEEILSNQVYYYSNNKKVLKIT